MDYILWYARDAEHVKYRSLFRDKTLGGEGADKYDQVQLRDGTRRTLTTDERIHISALPAGARVFCLDNLTSQSVGRDKGPGAASWFPVEVGDRKFLPNAQSRWKTNEAGIVRLLAAERVSVQGNSLRYVRYLDDFQAFGLSNNWDDIGGIQSRADPKIYVVQTATTAVARCVLMTTDPGDLVLDPTCGSGTTAQVAEQWGRRWITCDTSRVAMSLARQRLLTARFPFYSLRSGRVRDGFVYRRIPHITLKSIAQNLTVTTLLARV